MSSTDHIDTVRDGFLRELEVDYESLAGVYYSARLCLVGLEDREAQAEAKRITLEVVRQLLIERRICAGFLAPGGAFAPWKMAPLHAYQRIVQEWISLGRELQICDIAWFAKKDECG
jgi:hypothetical protein